MSARGVLRILEGNRLGFWCRGCEHIHVIDCGGGHGWVFNDDYDRPTFQPSVLITYRHPKGHSNANPAPIGWQGEYEIDCCHSFVRDGQIQFLSDCTHALAGKTVPLEPF